MAEIIPIKAGRCPLCGKPAQAPYRPFCSKRCMNLDLGKWLNEDYRIATEDAPDPDSDTEGEE
ncbi:MAG: DNA gyrase inhibitor YacG [Rhodospirillales bacterium RIFCSPLOWO2_12_FULL_58_28]|nr:MAG: DNA gyrase inhibitor YacG [Rhodospirillales bacterium RIFCSPLOWO2_02_FULL_58_16]OHC77499.1 MAG: DNA gyrase inhibitor YacG [Rhodospirillales bacterium RIFCSPLOWO2_12_FULL_58_28]